jgi:hypothetical protein
MIVKPATSWITTNTVTLFMNNSSVVVLSLTNNADIYKTPSPTLPVVQAALDELSADQAATADGGHSATVKRDNSRLVLANLMRQLASYVSVACNGDLHSLILSGFPPQKTTRTPVGILPAPQGLVLKQGALSGTLIVKANPVFGASTYNWTCTANTPGAVPITSQTTAASCTFSGLTPGMAYTIAVNAVGAAGPSNWSNPASQIVI